LITKHAAPNVRVHSFGFGTGVDAELVKKTAEAGKGRCFFIKDATEIYKTVVTSLMNTHLDYRVVKQLQIKDTTGKVHSFNFTELRVTHGENVEWSTLLDPGVKALAYTWIFEDPNTKKTETYEGTFENVQSLAL
jgi:protein-tyrosine-phosphatase